MENQDITPANTLQQPCKTIHPECIHTLFEQQVASKPDLPALLFGQDGLTYSRFNAYTNQLAHRLIELGVGREVCVGLAMERSFEMVIAIFAVLKAGGAYVPVDPEWPDDRVRFVLTDASVNILITQEKFSKKFCNYPQQLIKPDISHWDFGGLPAINPAADVNPHDLAYILFTSGSTGKPKGARIEHHSIVNLVACIQRLYPIAEGDVVLLKSPYTFDGSVWELYGWVIPCGSLYIAAPGIEKDPGLLLNTLVSKHIRFTFFVSSMLSSFLEYIEMSKTRVVADELKWVSVGGEVVSPTLVQRFYKIFGSSNVGLFNVYGPTETTVYASTYLCRSDDTGKIPVGKAVDHDFIYVLDTSLNPVAPMTEGEIFIGGEGVARGYLNRPELDALKFLPDPFRQGEKMYATGDIGRFLPDGNLDFIGRRDFQIKMRGLRIELGEIENALLAIPGIRDAAVIVNRDCLNDDSLVAFLVTEPDSGMITEDEPTQAHPHDRDHIAGELNKSLPAYMIPSEFVMCREFPVTENGKLDRKALKLPKARESEFSDDFVTPSTDEELWLAEIWQEVLSMEKISIHDSFFKLGGHSLKAARIAARIAGKSGMEMSIKTIFDNPTIYKLAKILQESALNGTREQSGISRVERHTKGYPLNDNQLELWFLHKMDVTRIQHNILFRLEIMGNPDILVFQEAVNALIETNESLRITVRVQNGVPLQFLCEPFKIVIPVADLNEFAQQEKEIRLEEAGKSIGHQVFNLETDRLFRLDWFHVSEEHHVVFFCIHHIIFDGWSMFNFFNGLKLAYLNLSDELPAGMPNHAIQNVDFAVYQQNDTREKLVHQLGYWKKIFAKQPSRLMLQCRKPFDITKVAQTGRRIWWKIPADELSALKSFTVEHGCSLFGLLLSVYKIMLCNFSGNHDIVVGTPYANRNRWETEPLIGYFTNMMALRNQISGEEPFSALVKKVQYTALDAFENADLPFGHLVRALGMITSPGNYPLFQVVFVMQNWAMPDMNFGGFTLSQKELGSGGVKAELMLNAEETGNELECWLEYDTALYDEEPLQEMVNFINDTIHTIINDPVIPVGKLLKKSQHRSNEAIDSPSCVLIGETGLLTECGEMLLRHRYLIKGLISPDPACTAWGRTRGIGLISGYQGILSTDWKMIPFDYLFSIVNSKILKHDMLKTARKGCINYHDSLLPAYAGVHATSWALMMGEEMHGVSWHAMTGETDAGGIVASARVAISSEDTAFTLNVKCFEAALQSFSQVLETLGNERDLPATSIKPVSYFGLFQKPHASAVLDFRKSAPELYNMVRALNLGEDRNNALAIPKLITKNGVFLVLRASCDVQQVNQKPGTVLGLTGQSVTIAASQGVLVVTAIANLSGEPIAFSSAFNDVAVDSTLPVLTTGQLTSIDDIVRKVAPNERYRIKQLSQVSDQAEPVIPVSSGNLKPADIPLHGNMDGNIRASLLFFLACYSNSTSFAAGISTHESCCIHDESSGIFSDVMPYILPSITGVTCEKALDNIELELVRTISMGTYLLDLIARTPEINRKFAGTGKPGYRFILSTSLETGYSISGRYPSSTILIPGSGRITVISPNSVLIDDLQCRIPLFFQRLADHKSEAVTSINLLNASELDLHESVNMQWDLSDVQPFLKLFDSQVQNHGLKTAIRFGDQQVTYIELYKQSNRVAGYLTTAFTGIHDDIVAICLDRSPEFIASILGILRSGKAYLPLDPGMPTERIKTILLDSGVSHVFSKEKFREILPDSVKVIDAGSIINQQIEFSEPDISNVQENQPAYVIFTSGTTGKPKGVIISRRSLDIFIKGCIDRYALTQADRVLQFASLAFDASVEEIFPTLACGATLVLRSNDSISSMNRFLDFCRENAISVLDLPTAFWHQLMVQSSDLEKVPDRLRLVIIGGERAGNFQVGKWLNSQWRGIMLYNTYGPTETTVVATAYKLSMDMNVNELPVGKPVLGAKAIIRNVFGQPGIPTLPNELLVGGEIVSTGYLHQKALSAEKFSTIGLGNESLRFYSTGDRVTILPDGNLVFAGRIDAQIKIRGFRVEIGEIEAAINQLSRVNDCVVVPFENAGKEVSLVAYVVLNQGFISSELGNLLRSVLPDYMIPAYFMGIPFIPLTINHKPDLKALPQPDLENAGTLETDKPVTVMEKIVFSAWVKQLGTAKFGINHDFFRMGGHSLMALAVMSDLERQTGKVIPLASLFSFPTVKTLAAAIDQEKEREGWRPLVCIKPGTGRIPLFIIHGGGLNILLFNTLAQKMASGQPVYGIQAHGLDGKSTPYDHINDIVGHYMREIRSVLPQGPFALAGFSIGGLIAHELCCRFVEQNEPVAFLGMFDTAAVSYDKDLTGYQRKFLWFRETAMHLLFNALLIITDPVNTIPKKLKWLRYRVKMKLLDQDAVNREDLVDVPSNLIYVAKANIKAIGSMTLRHFPGTLHLFRARKRNFYVSDPVFLGWKKFARNVVVHQIPGEHSLIFAPPNDTEFARVLQQCMDDLETK